MDNLFLNTYVHWLGNTTLKLLLKISFLLVESSTFFNNYVWYPEYKECLHFSILVVGGGRSLWKYACAFDKNNPDWKCRYWRKIKPLFCSFPNLRSGKKCKGRLIAGYSFPSENTYILSLIQNNQLWYQLRKIIAWHGRFVYMLIWSRSFVHI